MAVFLNSGLKEQNLREKSYLNVQNVCDVESAQPRCVVELGGPSHYFPTYVVFDVLILKTTHME